jgi:hypothetical protein
MKIFTLILSIIAIALIIFNASQLDFDKPFEGDSFTAVLTIISALCALLLLQILRLSKKIERLNKKKS